MRGVVIYESMYGNTHRVANAIAAGLAQACEVSVAAVGELDVHMVRMVRGADLIVVGGPTHVHGVSRRRTRDAAVQAAQEPDSDLALEPGASSDGLREWFESTGSLSVAAAAFDTRTDMPALITGRASHGLAKMLGKHGCRLLVKPESFLVDQENHLVAGEEERARQWGVELARQLTGSSRLASE
jgi:hypothetical protein